MAKDDDMDSDADDNSGSDDSAGSGLASGFKHIDTDEDDDDEDGWDNGKDSNADSDDGDAHESDSDEDGIRGGRVRGDAYEETKAVERQLRNQKKAEKAKKKKAKSAKSKKNVMYEADDYDAGTTDAVNLGLGNSKASSSVSKKRMEMVEMTLGERMKMKAEKLKIVGETKRIRVKGEGATREVKYIPKDVQKKKEEQDARRQKELEEGEGLRKRKRRGIKELGFKTPFKNKM
mmetsp:Transcript_17187/g.25009  ORF Transcript_17187/g.25009 Transcript_17187/m.25009 type:complete len:233 (-) Transcript_17187:528-1226(-)